MRACTSLLVRLPLPVLKSKPAPSRAECLLVWQTPLFRHCQRQRHHQQQHGRHRTCSALAAEQAAPPAACASQQPQVQTFDYTTLAAAVAELQAWVPAKVEAVVQQEASTALRLRTAADTGWLHICYHARYAHIGIGEAPARGSAAELYTFGTQLQAALRGLVLTDVLMPTSFERVLKLAFAQRPGEPAACQLIYECMARYSNLLLLGPDDTVLAAAHQVGQRMSSVRHVQVGRRWEPPPLASGLDPDSSATLEGWRDVLCRVAEAAPPDRKPSILQAGVRAFRGVSPQLMRDMLQAAGISPDSNPADLSPNNWQRLHQQWQAWLERLTSGSFAAGSCPQTRVYGLLGTQPHKVPRLLTFLHHYYTAPQQAEAFNSLKQQLTRAVSGAIARLQKKVESLRQQGGESNKHLQTQRLADMVMANVYRIQPGAVCVDVEDWDTGEPVTLQLDPGKSAVDYAETLYKQARKQRRAVQQVAPLLEAAARELEYLREVEVMVAQLEGASHLAALLEVQADLVAGKYVKAAPDAALADKAAAKARKAQKRGVGGGTASTAAGGSRDFRRYESPAGFTVLVGRNSRQNDELSCRLAKEGDVWMHARGVPGAHLLMRIPAGQVAGDDDLRFAADLAAWFSKARSEGKVDVTVANPKHLSKPTGAKPGQVMVKKEKVVLGQPDRSVAAQQGETD